jgi:hypothetical protein
MTVSFKEFRDRFPDASVLSDLLSVTDQRYVVKVTIQTRDLGTATGLSAHENLEIAEDNARQRALQALGLELPASSPSMPQASPAPFLEAASTASSQKQVNHPVQPEQTSPPIEAGDEVPHPVSELVAELTPEPTQPAPEAAKPATQSRSKSVHRTKVSPQPSEPAPEPIPDATDTAPPTAHDEPISAAHLPAPINLSDVIAQTDIELRRLGWTVEMGREYLEQTYDKRSRHELSEEELIQFLCHLESLPEPQTIA